MSTSLSTQAPPEPGKLVQLRKRPAIVKDVERHGDESRKLHLVTVEYLDGHDHPATDQVLWELEPSASSLKNAGWPQVHEVQPDKPKLYDAYTDAVRWTSLQSIRDLVEDGGDLPLVSPWASAVQMEPYQLTPLLKALNMPRVSLLLADDVGLGKTIQAGLIATELILRRRLKRMLIVVPASLQVQWQEEMKEKFHLDFTILDSDEVRRTQREMGSDVNPWAVHNRIITSMDYLRQEVIYQDFEAAARKRQEESSSAFAPWDLLIVDEAHHFAPKDPTEDSLRTRMMRRLTEWFEHRIFLTATPHNGQTYSFTGLLELLDPVRFVQTNQITDTDRRHIDTIMVRRLKREINEVSSQDRFAERTVQGVPVELTPEEENLFKALRHYRDNAHRTLRRQGKQEQNWGRFIFTLLNKRLLSSPYAFARTWWRHIGAEEFVEEEDLEQAIRDVEEDIDDDAEREDRVRVAAEDAGSWLFRENPDLESPAERVSQALRELGWTEEVAAEGPKAGLDVPDAKLDALLQHLQEGFPEEDIPPLVGESGELSGERVILFTEYKDTQDHILARLEEAGYEDTTVRAVYGGMNRTERDEIKQAFNNPRSDVRVLVGTDSASEGLNLQNECRYVAHYEIPWNPMRLEQRNGRVDRHGQARDVHVFHYTSNDEADQNFLAYVLEKVHEARNDLGSVGTVIDEKVHEHFWGGDLDQQTFGQLVDHVQDHDPAKQDLEDVSVPNAEEFEEAKHRFQKASKRYDLTPDSIQNVVESYLNLHRVALEETEQGQRIQGAKGRIHRFLQRNLANEQEAMPRLVFDPQSYLRTENGRTFYRPQPGTRLIRLGHPLTDASLAFFRRALWGQEEKVHRWTMTGYEPQMGNEVYARLDHLLTARNDLQEVVHSEMGSWWFHVTQDGLRKLDGPPELEGVHELGTEHMVEGWNDLRPRFLGYEEVVESLAEKRKQRVRDELEGKLESAGANAQERIEEEFKARMKELRKDMGRKRRERLQKMLDDARDQAKQMRLDPSLNIQQDRKVQQLEKRLSEEDLAVWDENMKLLKQRLEREQERFQEEVLPRRYSLADTMEFVEVGAKLFVPHGRDA